MAQKWSEEEQVDILSQMTLPLHRKVLGLGNVRLMNLVQQQLLILLVKVKSSHTLVILVINFIYKRFIMFDHEMKVEENGEESTSRAALEFQDQIFFCQVMRSSNDQRKAYHSVTAAKISVLNAIFFRERDLI